MIICIPISGYPSRVQFPICLKPIRRFVGENPHPFSLVISHAGWRSGISEPRLSTNGYPMVPYSMENPHEDSMQISPCQHFTKGYEHHH